MKFAKYMSNNDVQHITDFLSEFTSKHLFPFMKKKINLWNEQVAASRRNITSRLFSVGKKYFGSNTKAPTSITKIDEHGALMYTSTIYPAYQCYLLDTIIQVLKWSCED